jgi:hypothetical protein
MILASHRAGPAERMGKESLNAKSPKRKEIREGGINERNLSAYCLN